MFNLVDLMDIDDGRSLDAMEIDKPFLEKSKSDQFIVNHNLDLQKTADVIKFLEHKMEILAPYYPDKPYQALFSDNCLEFRLDRRQTTYSLDDEDNVKLLLEVSGAGKTRQLLEMLYQKFGYYLVSNLQQNDFGSGDLVACYVYSADFPKKARYFIEILYFVRAFVCNYLMDLGYIQPHQILVAQLHPRQFFGIDIFEKLFDSLAKRSNTTVGTKLDRCFDFVAIDEIQKSVETELIFSLPGSRSKRPFYSPLIYHSKHVGKFPAFIVSGTGINFQVIEELMGTGVMKDNLITCHMVISNMLPLDKDQVARYSRLILTDHNMEQQLIDEFVDFVSSYDLCHGRARFIALLLDYFLKHKNVDFSVRKFVSGLYNVDGDLFPLKFYRRDLEEKRTSFDKVIGVDTLGRIVRDGLIQYIMTGKATRKLSYHYI